MAIARLSPALLLLALFAAPAAAQTIPDDIPDLTGESPADKAQERLEERYRGVLSRFFTGGGFEIVPITANGFAWGANVDLGMNLRSGDALFLTASAREVPFDPTENEVLPRGAATLIMIGGGYQLRGTRFLPESRIASRTALSFGASAVTGDVSTVAVDVRPTYELLRRHTWTMPVGFRLGYAFHDAGESGVSRFFYGLTVGVKHFLGRREKLERTDQVEQAGPPPAPAER